MKPDYNRSILSVSSSILKYYNLDANYKSLAELDAVLKNKYKNIVFLILDCLGVNIINNNLSENNLLKKNILTTVTTIFPSTTVAATTAFHSGLSPYETGWLGWMLYFKEYDRMIEVFSGKDFYTEEKIIDPPGETFLKYEQIYEKICKKNQKVNLHKIFPSFAENGSKTFEELCSKIKLACENEGQNLISAYWDEPDHTIHYNGVKSNATYEVLKNIDDNLKKLAEELSDTLIIISADHGAVDVNEVYLNEIKELDELLSKPLSIESRFASSFIKEGMQEKFLTEFKKHFKDKYKLYSKEEFLKEQLLGLGKKHERIDSYLGDLIFISESNLAIRYALPNTKKKFHVADHAGLTKDEMLVPVIVVECKTKSQKFKTKS